MNFAIFVTYFLIGIQLLCMGNHVIVQKFYFPMMIFCVDDHRCSELRYGLCNKDHAGQSQFVDNEYRWPCYNPKPAISARFYKGFYCKISWVIVRFLAVGDMRKYVVFPMVFEAFLVVCNDLIPWQGVHPVIIASISEILQFSKFYKGFYYDSFVVIMTVCIWRQ